MAHDHHGHHHGHHHHHEDVSNLGLAFILNFLFTIIEIIGGIYTNSLAILSDAVHDLGDSFSLGLAWYFQKKSKQTRNKKFTYGYKRFSLVGAIVNSIVLLISSFFIIKTAIPRVFNPQEADPKGMFLLALLGIAVNGYAAFKLSSGSSHNEKVVSLHLIEDVLGWVAVLIGSLLIYFFGWYQIDPILSILIALFILYNVYRNLQSTISIILQATPDNVDLKNVSDLIDQTENVHSHHDLHVWTLDGTNNILTAHIVVDDQLSDQKFTTLKSHLKAILKKAKISHCTLEIERFSEACIDDCELEKLEEEDHNCQH